MAQTVSRLKLRVGTWNNFIVIGTALLLIGWLLNTPPGLLGKADALGYAVCHRIDLRSFHLGDRQLPLCARCTGMYLGAVLGLFYQAVFSRRRAGAPSRSIISALVILFLAFAFDGLNSLFSLIPIAPHLYEPQNWLRLVTGMGMGLVIAVALYPGFNQTVWLNPDQRPAMGSWKKFLFLIVLSGILILLVLTDNPLVLYPLALISAGGVLMLLTIVYSMVWVMILHTENHYQRPLQLLIPLVGGLGLALLQITLLDFGRYTLTGTWDGFHF